MVLQSWIGLDDGDRNDDSNWGWFADDKQTHPKPTDAGEQAIPSGGLYTSGSSTSYYRRHREDRTEEGCGSVNRRSYGSPKLLDCLTGDATQRWGVNGIGIVIDTSASHAYNCLLTYDDGKLDLQMVEPQTDEVIHRSVPGYSARKRTIIFA